MWLLGGWGVSTHPVFCLQARILISNGKKISKRNVSLQINNEAIQSCAKAAQNDGFCNAVNDPKMDITQQLATHHKSISY